MHGKGMQFLSLYRKYASKTYPPILPSEIKAIRSSYNLSQRAFAKLLDISVDTLQNYEIGRTHAASTATALFVLAREHPEVFKRKKLGRPRKFFR